MIQIELHGEQLHLLPERVLYWPRRETLLLADPHFGKAAAFRTAGIPIPGGTTADNLTQLTRAIEQTGAQRIICLGDLLHAKAGDFASLEMAAVRPILALQLKWSTLPDEDELLVERVETRDGHHLFIYPFEGKLVHQGLAALFAYRLSRLQPITFTLTVNDYGIELLSAEPAPLEEALAGTADHPPLLSSQNLLLDIPASLNASEMARRQFREIARVAGLIFQGYPGQGRSARHLQASTSLLYEVFTKYDQENKLLTQAHREVLERQLEQSRLNMALQRLAAGRVNIVPVYRPSPLSFPLFVERMQAQLTSEKLSDRVKKMVMQLEKAAGE
jgi:ATP-dependent Lhr-like helicase